MNQSQFHNARKRVEASITRMKRQLMPGVVDDHRDEYEQNRNPLHVWRAYQICREYKFEQPRWITVYLDEVAGQLISIEAAGKNIGKQLLKALGSEAGTVFLQFNEREKKRSIALRALELAEKHKEEHGIAKWDLIDSLVYEEFKDSVSPLSKSTVRNYRKEYQQIAHRIIGRGWD